MSFYAVPKTMRAVVTTGHGGLTALLRRIESGGLRAVVARTYPLSRVREAQVDFASKRHVGKMVLVPGQ